jgi:hypothetical protein
MRAVQPNGLCIVGFLPNIQTVSYCFGIFVGEKSGVKLWDRIEFTVYVWCPIIWVRDNWLLMGSV